MAEQNSKMANKGRNQPSTVVVSLLICVISVFGSLSYRQFVLSYTSSPALDLDSLSLSDQEGLSLRICNCQVEDNACAPHVVERTKIPCAKEFADHVLAGIPFVVRGGLGELPEQVKGGSETILEAILSKVDDLAKSVVRVFERKDETRHSIKVLMFLKDLLKFHRPVYAPQFPCANVKSEWDFLGTSRLPSWITTIMGESNVCNVWVGKHLPPKAELLDSIAKKAVTPLHYDHSHNIYGQLEGTKTFTLAPPHQRHLFVPYRSVGGIMQSGSRQQALNVLDVDINVNMRQAIKFDSEGGNAIGLTMGTTMIGEGQGGPLLFHNTPSGSEIRDKMKALGYKQLKETSISVTLEPGDILYIPPYWFHEVESNGKGNAAFNHWWNSAGWLDKIMKKIDNIASAEMPIEMPLGANVLPDGSSLFDSSRYSGPVPWNASQRDVPTSPKLASLQKDIMRGCKLEDSCEVLEAKRRGLGESWEKTWYSMNPNYAAAAQ
ncbi:hypothetical protein TrVE_jg765 [Triparma verrucosa]|uniref:JmjC domain-containing protein n=1 Tax=Triparma verrucosa TaxID=1606542 RepID=A0A9W7FBZ6_9STRA|nr:hypothetical protein TrVE_jg765 [Triparma verrucosa]